MPSRQECLNDALSRLTAAYRLLGDAADDLRGLGFPDVLGRMDTVLNCPCSVPLDQVAPDA